MALADETTSIPIHRHKAYSATQTSIWMLIVVLLLAAAVLPSLINIGRYQRRIAQIISNSIGRPVHMATVKLRLLPRPGFEVSDFVVDEDPAFGAEPMLRSASVVASVRLVSMWRGRLEIARIHFDEPSLNLVRRTDGQWNFGTVLLKASTTANAPTAQRHVSSVPRFPYIEATNARINFKAGDEKKPFSFLNADLSVWLDHPDEWRLRFEAQPVRTDLDLDLADTGILKINGSIKRAQALNQVPLMLHAEWTKAPLGQLSRILAGLDAGWRGDLEMRADITGTGENAELKTQLKATSVHRIEFAPAEPMDLDANCQATYTRQTRSLEGVVCTSPVGNGHLLLRGSVRGMQQSPLGVFSLQMQKVPVSAALGLARSVRQGFAPNLKAVGSIDGTFQYSAEALGAVRLRGSAIVGGLKLNAPALDRPLLLPPLRLVAGGEDVAATQAGKHNRRKGYKKNMHDAEESAKRLEPALLLSSFDLPTGGPSPLAVDGRFTGRGYQMHFAGNATVKSLLDYCRAFGLLRYTVSPLAPVGSAELDLRTGGAWLTPIVDPDHRMSATSTDGQLQLKNARITTNYLAAPIDLVSAHAVFRGVDVSWDPVAVIYGKLHADGSLQYSQLCLADPDCVSTFRLKFITLDIASAQATLLGGSGRTQFLEELLARLDHRPHPWPALSGTVEAATLTLGQLSLHDAKATIELKGNQVVIQSFDGRALGGGLHLTGTLDASGQQPDYAVEAKFAKVNAADIAALFHEHWGTGQITATTRLQLAGYKTEDLASSARGTFHWDWTQGNLSVRETEGGSDALKELPPFEQWSAEGTIGESKLSLTSGDMIPAWGVAGGSQPVRGTISFKRQLLLAIGPAIVAADGKATSAASLNGTFAQPLLQINQAASPPAISKSETTTSEVVPQ